MTLAGLEPAIFGSEDQRLIHQATGPRCIVEIDSLRGLRMSRLSCQRSQHMVTSSSWRRFGFTTWCGELRDAADRVMEAGAV